MIISQHYEKNVATAVSAKALIVEADKNLRLISHFNPRS